MKIYEMNLRTKYLQFKPRTCEIQLRCEVRRSRPCRDLATGAQPCEALEWLWLECQLRKTKHKQVARPVALVKNQWKASCQWRLTVKAHNPKVGAFFQ